MFFGDKGYGIINYSLRVIYKENKELMDFILSCEEMKVSVLF